MVSVGTIRLLLGRLLGAGSATSDAMVVEVVDWRLIFPASASVPVFTDQRSTPQLPVVEFWFAVTASCSSWSGCGPCRILALTPPTTPKAQASTVTRIARMRRERRWDKNLSTSASRMGCGARTRHTGPCPPRRPALAI